MHNSTGLALRIWFGTAFFFSAEITGYVYYTDGFRATEWYVFLFVLVVSAIGSIPAFLILLWTLHLIRRKNQTKNNTLFYLFLSCFSICGLYAVGYAYLAGDFETSKNILIFLTALFIPCLLSLLICFRYINALLSHSHFAFNTNSFILQNTTDMQQNSASFTPQPAAPEPNVTTPLYSSNRMLIKAVITGILTLLMLIPVNYVENLLTEREARQKEVIEEVSEKWAGPQTVTPPYLVVPYKTADPAKKETVVDQLIILPENVLVTGNLAPEKRHRSNYDVLLYRTQLNISGEFQFALPRNIKADSLLLSDAKICTGISDNKGIEKQVVISMKNSYINLSPGLPVSLDSNGLSAPVELSMADLTATLPFRTTLELKGSRQLHFKPMSGNSHFQLQSTWPHPSFDGNVIPVKDKGDKSDSEFPAGWSFSNANLPFSTVLQGDAIRSYDQLAFGVSLVQPADQYARAMRSIKYAIMIIGLTFALFFIIEIFQKNPVHPIQYGLVGLALVIFYSLLMSISEFIPFSYAYLIAAAATVILVTMYTKSHFRNWKTAGIFGGVLSGLYSFIYVLISLEDTALLVGSIALFMVLAIIMYVSRRINWYHPLSQTTEPGYSSSL